MQAVEVMARWDTQGEVTPIQFRWQGSLYGIESVGRRWRDESGLHILVMPSGERVYELIFQPDQMKWFINVRARGPAMV